jgi:ABC-type transporter Mla subunit MlaD
MIYRFLRGYCSMSSLKEETAMAALTEDVVQTIQSAAKLLTGHKRRRFQAETALKYCNGSARQAEDVFGWGRAAVDTGLNELRTGFRCLDAYELRGRKKSEEVCPALVDHIHRLVEPQAQADPKFQTPFAFTRMTARAVRDALVAIPELKDSVPCRQTVGELLNRIGYRLRRVQKTRPEKKSPRPTRSSETSRALATSRRPIPTG